MSRFLLIFFIFFSNFIFFLSLLLILIATISQLTSLLRFSLKGPEGIVNPLPSPIAPLKQTIFKSVLIEVSCKPSSNIIVSNPFKEASFKP